MSLASTASLALGRIQFARNLCGGLTSQTARYLSSGGQKGFDAVFNPTPEHAQLRAVMRAFTEKEVEPAALRSNRVEEANWENFHKLAKMGMLGLTLDPQYGGSGMDAVAAVIMAEEVSASDPSFAMTFGAHANLFANNLNQNGNHEQKSRFLPAACAGTKIGGMCMSEPG
jgi:isovaleryl-CoA dehydrogenase